MQKGVAHPISLGVPQIFAKFLGGEREDSPDWFPVTLTCSPFAKICGTPKRKSDFLPYRFITDTRFQRFSRDPF